ncbi:hypothetical protein PENSPDRAFT_336362 [Peniophora sp. CONT]|nr:hypothetical protein PENSPDRAFT_336362 [Peniophora sp. CONT]
MPPTIRSSAHKGPAAGANAAITLQPVATHADSLPDELLLAIFNLTLKLDSWTVFTALDLSQVCRRWRRLALSAPELWSTVPRTNTTLTKLCLKRSKKSPIDISIPSCTPSWIECMPAMRCTLQHIERARSIHLTMDVFDDDPGQSDEPQDSSIALGEVFKRLSTRAAPALDSLQLCFDGTVVDDYYDFVPSLPHKFFGGTPMPRLSDVGLEYCTIPSLISTGLLSPALTRLYLRDVRGWHDIDDMIRCLQAVPHLKSLHWVDHGTLEDGFDYPFRTVRSRIHQPRCARLGELQNLCLEGSHSQNMVIFSYISLPENARVKLASSYCRMTFAEVGLPDQEVDDLTALFAEALGGHFANALSRGVYFDSLFIGSRGGIRLETRHHSIDQRDDTLPPKSDLLPDKFELSPAEPDDPRGPKSLRYLLAKNFMATWSSLPIFTEARSITFPASLWKSAPDAMLRFTRAREVRFHDHIDDLREFCAGVLTARPCPYPALECLHLEELDFIADDDVGRDLLNALQAGSPVRRLTIVRCDLEDDMFDTLNTLLGMGAVQWDRKDKTHGTKERARRGL